MPDGAVDFLIVAPPGCPTDNGLHVWPRLIEGGLYDRPVDDHCVEVTVQSCLEQVEDSLQSTRSAITIEWTDAAGHHCAVRIGLRSRSTLSIAGTVAVDRFEAMIERLDELVVELNANWAAASCGQPFRGRFDLHELAMLERADLLDPRRTGLMGIGPVAWFGQSLVERLGGDSVFGSIPAEWVERGTSAWKVYGVEDPFDCRAFEVERWSTRERTIIETIGAGFFFDVEAGELACKPLVMPSLRAKPVYLIDDMSGELAVVSPD